MKWHRVNEGGIWKHISLSISPPPAYLCLWFPHRLSPPGMRWASGGGGSTNSLQHVLYMGISHSHYSVHYGMYNFYPTNPRICCLFRRPLANANTRASSTLGHPHIKMTSQDFQKGINEPVLAYEECKICNLKGHHNHSWLVLAGQCLTKFCDPSSYTKELV